MNSSEDLFSNVPGWAMSANSRVHIAIVGAGGTGGFLASHIARLQNILESFGRRKWDVVIFDPKDVTPISVTKQMFLYQEIGMNKADALTSRLNRVYNLNFRAVDTLFNFNLSRYNIVLGCTDSIEFRNRMMDNTHLENVIWIDSGCYADYGQIICSLENIWPNYRELGLELKEQEVSCGAEQSYTIQHPAINPLLASVMYGWVYDFLIGKRINWLQNYVNLSEGKMTSGLITLNK